MKKKNKLKSGDILITTATRRNTSNQYGHIVLYVGNALIRKKFPNSKAEFVSASYRNRSPGCGGSKSEFENDGYHIYRYNGDYSGKKKNAYTGCASGES